DAQVDDLARQPVRLRLRIALHGADQNQQARPDLADDVVIDSDAGFANPLDKRAHGGCQSPILSAWMKASCGISTLPNWRMRFLPSFCFSRSLRLRVASPP